MFGVALEIFILISPMSSQFLGMWSDGHAELIKLIDSRLSEILGRWQRLIASIKLLEKTKKNKLREKK